MEYAACTVPAAPVRKKSSHKSEMVNQLLFGESMSVIKKTSNWLKIQSVHDNYEGWVRSNLIEPVREKIFSSGVVAGELVNTLSVGDLKMHVPIGSSLGLFTGERGKVGNLDFQFTGYSFNRNEIKPNETIVKQLTIQWLNAPYLWGGRTPFGVDCSGFVQVIYKMMGIDLLRDAWQQSGQGIKIKKIENAKCGDLAFFNNSKGRIVHVGIMISNDHIIHSSGKVRIDVIDKKGIINSDTGKRTHTLAGFRRYW